MSQPPTTRRIWLVSPYHTGSHRAWAEGLQRHSRHQMSLLAMAGRFWKWRMQGGPLELAATARQRLAVHGAPDAVIATDMLNLPAWLGLLRRDLPANVPLLLYMHENQLTYPWRPGEKQDLTYAMINWLSQLAADRIVFNSEFHRRSWFSALPNLLKHFPDYNQMGLIDAVEAASRVLPVGIRLPETAIDDRVATADAPLILWNQRWEYDKRPDRFFALLYRLAEQGIRFRVAVVGENFRNTPAEFDEARRRLDREIVEWGYVTDVDRYRSLLAHADLVISTAIHEFFGISILEAIAAGAFPLLPARLSYPELIPPELHPACLYADDEELYAKAVMRLTAVRPAPPSLRAFVQSNFAWPAVAPRYDDLVDDLVAGA